MFSSHSPRRTSTARTAGDASRFCVFSQGFENTDRTLKGVVDDRWGLRRVPDRSGPARSKFPVSASTDHNCHFSATPTFRSDELVSETHKPNDVNASGDFKPSKETARPMVSLES